MNTLNITGRLTATPESKATGSGIQIAKFFLAVDEFVKGEKRANFFEVTAFGKVAEFICSYVNKGDKVAVMGSIRQERWEDKDGGKHSKVVVLCKQLEPMVKRASAEAGTSAEPEEAFAGVGLDDDLPF